ncbi:MAG: sodium-dependent transporter [Muribaculaceae bacterium]|nr:sodium-dependent transporter [Muribaculaceae bacterium]
MKDKIRFSSKLGLIAATVGSAVGLGNIWRFPAEVQENGGAAFLLVYLVCVCVLGIPVMLAEFTVGRSARADAIHSFQKLTPGKPWWIVGAIGVVASFLILGFYMVVSGWTLEYLVASVDGSLFKAEAPCEAVDFGVKMQEYVQTDVRPILFTLSMLVLNAVVLWRGVTKGIERLSNILMPLLFLLLIVFCCVSLTLPEASEGLKYFFTPDFSKIDGPVIVNALGQAFFSLSLGLGILITYASYYPGTTSLGRTAVTVSMLDLAVAILMGMIIFPVVTTFGIGDGDSLRGGTLVFVTIPEVFTHMQCTRLWSSLFFLLISVAALTSTISLGQVSVAFLQDAFRWSRHKAITCLFLLLLPISVACSLSQGSWNDFKLMGNNIFDFLDNFATNCLLPLGAMLLCIYIGWVLPKSTLIDQLTNRGALRAPWAPAVVLAIKYLAAPLIFVILISNFL